MKFDRRDLLKGGLALSAATLARPSLARAGTAYPFNPEPGQWRTYTVTTEIDIVAPQGASEAWVPLPSITASDWSKPQGDEWHVSSGSAQELTVGPYQTKMLYVQWAPGTAAPVATVTSRVSTQDRATDFSRPGTPTPLSPAERTLNLSPTRLIPTDGIVKQTADKITAGATTDLEKARAIYEWVVINTFRNPKTLGCGVGNIEYMLKSGNLGGKCADLNALYVGLARASGQPARDLYGIRVAPSKFGYKSLGTKTDVITKAQHCRAEVYLADYGWVPVDPADVRKVILEEPPGHLAMDDPKVVAARNTLFGAWESNWIAYNQGHDITLPGAAETQIGFLMYPQTESGGAMRDCLAPATCKYGITSGTPV